MKIHMKWKFISDSFYHMLISYKRKKTQICRVFLPILLRKTRQRRRVTYDVIDELRRLSLSKSCPALCHKLIYEIAIFHSINGETCDKIALLPGAENVSLTLHRDSKGSSAAHTIMSLDRDLTDRMVPSNLKQTRDDCEQPPKVLIMREPEIKKMGYLFDAHYIQEVLWCKIQD